MKALLWTVLVTGLLATGCRKPTEPENLTAAKASAERIAHLERKVDLLQRVIAAMEENARKNKTTPRTNAVSTNATGNAENEVKHQQYEQVMISLAEDVAGLEESEQNLDQRLRTMTEAIIALEQAVLALDAEIRQIRAQ